MTAELISVGTELLLGEILNTDAQFLASELSMLGIDVYHQCVVGDNPERLAECFKTALGRADIVIASGGLGPTPDDLTKEIISECMGEKLVLHNESLERMKAYFARVGREMCDNNIKQAMLPENCIVLPNNNGTAPGCIIEKNGKTAVMLPGPPAELQGMYLESVKPYLELKSENKLFTRTYHIFGIGESKVAELLSDLMEKSTNPTVAPYAKSGEVYLRIAAKAKTAEESDAVMKETDGKIRELLGDMIYSTDGKGLPETVFELMREKGLTVSAAESCTGGLFVKLITDFSGSSAVLNESYVTYANEAKVRLLGVDEEAIKRFGVVSAEVARSMAEGVRKRSGADIGVGITGIAGPTGATPDKPVGLVYAAVSFGGETTVNELRLSGKRGEVRYKTCLNVFDMIRRRII